MNTDFMSAKGIARLVGSPLTLDKWKTAKNSDGQDVAAAISWRDKVGWRGKRLVIGVRDPKPIDGAPEGKQRLRMRNDCFAVLFIKTAVGIRQFLLEDLKDRWLCSEALEQGRNIH